MGSVFLVMVKIDSVREILDSEGSTVKLPVNSRSRNHYVATNTVIYEIVPYSIL
ncbi:MAG: hypothetical protein ACI9SQ_001631 [Rubritalea sp.]|jgi:hypothetical protein